MAANHDRADAAPSVAEMLDELSVSEKPYQMNIMDANGDPVLCEDGLPSYILVYSINSSKGQDLKRHAYKSARRPDGKENAPKDYDAVIEGIATNCATLTAGWRLVSPKTKKVIDLPFTYANALAYYRGDGRALVREQVQRAFADDALFMKD